MDPYKVLGISPDATDDEVKKAYKTLVKKYHPDMNVGASNISQLEEKFKQVQEAYNMIMDARERGEQNSSYGGFDTGRGAQSYGDWFGGFGGFEQQQDNSQESLEMRAAANYINARRFHEALNVLKDIQNRNARWYYLSALANAGCGNTTQAREQAMRAAQMDPSTLEYRFLAEQLSGRSQWYEERGRRFGGRPVVSAGRMCCTVLACYSLCNCCFFGRCY